MQEQPICLDSTHLLRLQIRILTTQVESVVFSQSMPLPKLYLVSRLHTLSYKLCPLNIVQHATPVGFTRMDIV